MKNISEIIDDISKFETEWQHTFSEEILDQLLTITNNLREISRNNNNCFDKTLKTNNCNIEPRVSNTFTAYIGEFLFEKDEEFPWINVSKVINATTKNFICEIDEEDITSIIDLNDFKVYVLRWYLNNVEIIKED